MDEEKREQKNLKQMGILAKSARFAISAASEKEKNEILKAIINNLTASQEEILQANLEDIDLAKKQKLTDVMIDRLSLQGRLSGILKEACDIITLPDPIGEIYDEQLLPNHLKVCKRRTPIGVLGVIYESRPNVTIDVSLLAIKSGNCALMRGGSETLNTNRFLIEVIQKSLKSQGMPSEIIQFIDNSDRALVKDLLHMHEYIDLIIPRGNAALQRFCLENSRIPVITGGIGICHLFVDESADLERSLKVIFNAKTQRPTVCNSLDTLLVHSRVASLFIPKVIETLGKHNVKFRLDEKSFQYAQGDICQRAQREDWSTEWLSLILGIKVVENLKEAIEHIHKYSSGHSDGILTEDRKNGEIFVRDVDSAAVYVNASTRFTDGGQLGLGAEVAISTQKLHARGPMGLKELTSYKWVIYGNYNVRS